MLDSTTTGQRFTQLIQQLGLSKNSFAQSLGKTATVIQHLVDERNKPGFDLLAKVLDVYPNVSSDWLLLGTGPMLRADAPPEPVIAPSLAPPVIDLAAVAGSRRRPAANGALLQPADIAATLALAATQASPAANGAGSSKPADAKEPELAPTVVAPPLATPAPSLAAAPAPAVAAPSSPPPAPAALPDAAYLAAMLQAQHLQHQLALAEQRNQHLLEQQALLKQLVAVLQK